jgi:hypothetical protein
LVKINHLNKEVTMNKEFVPYQEALELKELGFDIPSISGYSYPDSDNLLTQAILYQQAFRWLYQKLGIEKGVMLLDTESQQLLLKELIDKVSSKHSLV